MLISNTVYNFLGAVCGRCTGKHIYSTQYKVDRSFTSRPSTDYPHAIIMHIGRWVYSVTQITETDITICARYPEYAHGLRLYQQHNDYAMDRIHTAIGKVRSSELIVPVKKGQYVNKLRLTISASYSLENLFKTWSQTMPKIRIDLGAPGSVEYAAMINYIMARCIRDATMVAHDQTLGYTAKKRNRIDNNQSILTNLLEFATSSCDLRTAAEQLPHNLRLGAFSGING